MVQILKATSPADFLALIPRLAGFQPERSIVVVPFNGARTHGVMRFDLPAEPSVDQTNLMADFIARIPDVTAAIVIVYTDGDPAASAAVAKLLAIRLEAAGVPVPEALYVAGDSWGDYFRPELEPQPAGWISASEHADPSIPTLSAVHALPEWDEVVAGGIAGCLGDYASVTSFDPLKVIERIATTAPERLRSEHAAQLLAVLVRPALRDVALIQWARNAERGADALATQLDYSLTGKSADAQVAETLLGRGERPDVARLESALAVCRHLAVHTEDVHAAAAFVSAGWIAWALGRSSEASGYIERALEIDPELSFAGLMARVIGASMLPDWAFNRP